MTEPKPRKTWAREVATALLIYLCVLLWSDKLQAAEIISLPTFGFVLYAYGVKNEEIATLLRSRATGGK